MSNITLTVENLDAKGHWLSPRIIFSGDLEQSDDGTYKGLVKVMNARGRNILVPIYADLDFDFTTGEIKELALYIKGSGVIPFPKPIPTPTDTLDLVSYEFKDVKHLTFIEFPETIAGTLIHTADNVWMGVASRKTDKDFAKAEVQITVH